MSYEQRQAEKFKKWNNEQIRKLARLARLISIYDHLIQCLDAIEIDGLWTFKEIDIKFFEK